MRNCRFISSPFWNRVVLVDQDGVQFDTDSLGNGWLEQGRYHFWSSGVEEDPDRTIEVPFQPEVQPASTPGHLLVQTPMVSRDGSFLDELRFQLPAQDLVLHDVSGEGADGIGLAPALLRFGDPPTLPRFPFDFSLPQVVSTAFDPEVCRCSMNRLISGQVEYLVELHHLKRPARIRYSPLSGLLPDLQVHCWPALRRAGWDRVVLLVRTPQFGEVRISALPSAGLSRSGSQVAEVELFGSAREASLPLDVMRTPLVGFTLLRDQRTFSACAFDLRTLVAEEPREVEQAAIWIDLDDGAVEAGIRGREQGCNPLDVELAGNTSSFTAPLGGPRPVAPDDDVRLGPWRLVDQAQPLASNISPLPEYPAWLPDAQIMATTLANVLLEVPFRSPHATRVAFPPSISYHPSQDALVRDALETSAQIVTREGLTGFELCTTLTPDAQPMQHAAALAAGALSLQTSCTIPLSYALLADLRGFELRLALCVRGTAFNEWERPLLLAAETIPVGLAALTWALAGMPPSDAPDLASLQRHQLRQVLRGLRRPAGTSLARSSKRPKVELRVQRFFQILTEYISSFGAGALRSTTLLSTALRQAGDFDLRSDPTRFAAELLAAGPEAAALRVELTGWGWAPLWEEFLQGGLVSPFLTEEVHERLRERLRAKLGPAILPELPCWIGLPNSGQQSMVVKGLHWHVAPLPIPGPGRSLAPCGISGVWGRTLVAWDMLCGSSPLADVQPCPFVPTVPVSLRELGFSTHPILADPNDIVSPLGRLLADELPTILHQYP